MYPTFWNPDFFLKIIKICVLFVRRKRKGRPAEYLGTETRMLLQKSISCRQCLLTNLTICQSPYIFAQIRFKKRIRLTPDEYPDHQKKVILGTYHTLDPETNLLYLKDIEAVRKHNLRRLKGHTKGFLYQASIHGKAEVIQEVMKAYDRQGTQDEWREKGRLKLLPQANFYLARAYYILRDRGDWMRFELDRNFRLVPESRPGKERWSRWTKWKAIEKTAKHKFSGADSSSPAGIVNSMYRQFLEKMTDLKGSQHAIEWGVETRPQQQSKPTELDSETAETTSISQADATPSETTAKVEEIPEIWKPNQKDEVLRQATFSHPSQQTLAQATKQLRSSWSPTTFHELNLIKGLPEAVEKVTLGHLIKTISPTDIQSLAIPIITKLDTRGFEIDAPNPENYRSFLIAAETGSGKTLAYLIPLINRLKREEEWALKNPTDPNSIFNTHRAASPRAIIIVPTSELAEQIYHILKQLSHEIKFTVCAFLPKFDDSIIRKSILSKYIDVLVSTPHRLDEFIQSKELKAKMVRYVIIDEADTIFDRSFSGSLNAILDVVKHQLTHLVLCTATIPVALEKQLRYYHPGMHRIVAPKIHTAPRRIDFSVVLERDKRQALLDTLRSIQTDNTEPEVDIKRALVFCNIREGVREVYEYLKAAEDTDKSDNESGNLELIPFTRDNFDRHTALERFNERATSPSSKKLRILITTDMGSRGLDTITAKTVVLYDVPYSSIDLLHRLGRTARAGTRGRAVMIVSKAEYRGKTKEWVNEIRDRLIRGEALV